MILSRKANEVIRINDDISIVIVDVRGDKVRLGFDCPKSVAVHREEVYQAIQLEKANQAAAAGGDVPRDPVED